jgi:hypothetical protein
LTFTASVTYYVWDKKKVEYVLNEDGTKATFGPYSGTGTCNFIATSKPWKVELSTESVVVRRAIDRQQWIVPFKKVTAKLIDADSAKTVTISSSGGGELRFGMSENIAGIWYTSQQSLSLTIPKDGTEEFYVSGEQQSASVNDAIIVATSTDSNSEIVGSIQMTVLWVIISLKSSGMISDDNSAKAFILADPESGIKLGKRWFFREEQEIFFTKIGYGYEFHGSVEPNDFQSDVVFQRDVAGESTTNNQPPVREKSFESLIPGELEVNDTSLTEFRDDTPPDIYDHDMPATWLYWSLPEYYYKTVKGNFRQFATYGDIRCSDIVDFHVELCLYIQFSDLEEITEYDATLGAGHIQLTTSPSP